MVDKQGEVVNESVRRMVDECLKYPEIDANIDSFAYQLVNPEQVKCVIALRHVMKRIMNSVDNN